MNANEGEKWGKTVSYKEQNIWKKIIYENGICTWQ